MDFATFIKKTYREDAGEVDNDYTVRALLAMLNKASQLSNHPPIIILGGERCIIRNAFNHNNLDCLPINSIAFSISGTGGWRTGMQIGNALERSLIGNALERSLNGNQTLADGRLACSPATTSSR